MAFSLSSLIKKVVYWRRNGEELVKEHPETDGGQVLLTAQNGVTGANAQAEFEALRAALGTMQSTIDGQTTMHVVTDIAARTALTGLKVGDQAWVIDASADATVTAGAAKYIVQAVTPGANEGDPATITWAKTAEAESMDVVLQWANIQGKEVDVMHVAAMPESMPEGLADGGLLVVDASAA